MAKRPWLRLKNHGSRQIGYWQAELQPIPSIQNGVGTGNALKIKHTAYIYHLPDYAPTTAAMIGCAAYYKYMNQSRREAENEGEEGFVHGRPCKFAFLMMKNMIVLSASNLDKSIRYRCNFGGSRFSCQ